MAYNLFSEYLYYDSAETKLETLKNNIIDLCSTLNIKSIDFYSLTLNKPEIYLDGVHLNAKGHDLLFKTAFPYFK